MSLVSTYETLVPVGFTGPDPIFEEITDVRLTYEGEANLDLGDITGEHILIISSFKLRREQGQLDPTSIPYYIEFDDQVVFDREFDHHVPAGIPPESTRITKEFAGYFNGLLSNPLFTVVADHKLYDPIVPEPVGVGNGADFWSFAGYDYAYDPQRYFWEPPFPKHAKVQVRTWPEPVPWDLTHLNGGVHLDGIQSEQSLTTDKYRAPLFVTPNPQWLDHRFFIIVFNPRQIKPGRVNAGLGPSGYRRRKAIQGMIGLGGRLLDWFFR